MSLLGFVSTSQRSVLGLTNESTVLQHLATLSHVKTGNGAILLLSHWSIRKSNVTSRYIT